MMSGQASRFFTLRVSWQRHAAAILGLIGFSGTPQAGILASTTLQTDQVCPSAQSLLVIRGDQLPALQDTPIEQIALFRFDGAGLSPIQFQIDRKDQQDRYVLDEDTPPDPESDSFRFDHNDELVLRAAETGDRLPEPARTALRTRVVEIELQRSNTAESGWVYTSISGTAERPSSLHQVAYQPEKDSVQTTLYRIGFSRDIPFLIDSMRWSTNNADQWSMDVTDTMKIRHRGKLFGIFDFDRTHGDYSSALIAVKNGPLRVIRRTENRVRVLWKLKTPKLYIDYVMMPDGFVMDTIVDIPFNIGLFMSDVETLTTMDWNDDPALSGMYINDPESRERLYIDGTMPPPEHTFNSRSGDRFSIDSDFGSIFVHLDIPPDFPIEPWLYLRDAIDEPDPPENRDGQFGNMGFRTTGWENIDTEVHHLMFTICMARDRETEHRAKR